LRAHVAAGNLTLDGPVRDAGEKSAIESAAADRFGQGNGVGNLQVQSSADSAAWLAKVIPALPRKDSGYGPIDVTASKQTLTVSGQVPTAAAGHALLAAVKTASGRTAVDKLQIVGVGASGLLQTRIDGAIGGRAITFETGSAAITKAGQQVLAALVAPLKAAGSAKVVIGGHTDSVGTAANNLRLSKARANSVKVWLTKHGVNAKRLVAKGYGETKPIAPNVNEAGRRKNRRIEFTVLSG
jgi:OOP family OmpA-OmpF porin